MYTYVHTNVHVHVRAFTHKYTCAYTSTHRYMHLYAHLCIHTTHMNQKWLPIDFLLPPVSASFDSKPALLLAEKYPPCSFLPLEPTHPLSPSTSPTDASQMQCRDSRHSGNPVALSIGLPTSFSAHRSVPSLQYFTQNLFPLDCKSWCLLLLSPRTCGMVDHQIHS